MNFELPASAQRQTAEWLRCLVYPEMISRQRAGHESAGTQPSETELSFWKSGIPYEGAIGGGVTYEFTPTSIGTVVKARYAGYEDPLDLTDYDSW